MSDLCVSGQAEGLPEKEHKTTCTQSISQVFLMSYQSQEEGLKPSTISDKNGLIYAWTCGFLDEEGLASCGAFHVENGPIRLKFAWWGSINTDFASCWSLSPPPYLDITWSRGAPPGSPLYDSATRSPLPVIMMTRELPLDQPGRLTIS